MDDTDPITELLQRLRDEDPQAAKKLFARYSRRLTRLAERQLCRRVAAREDGEDVVQSAFRTFFRRLARGEFDIDNSTRLWRLLVRITLLKARAKARYHTAGPRDVRAEVARDSRVPGREPVAREPGPDEAVAFVDLIEELLRGRPDVFREVLERRLQGQRKTVIARDLNLTRKNVDAILRQLERRLTGFVEDLA